MDFCAETGGNSGSSSRLLETREFWSKHVLIGVQALREGATACSHIIIIPEYMLDPNSPYNPMNCPGSRLPCERPFFWESIKD